MEIENLYLNRQSCRNFSGEKVNEETLKKAIELANLAPSACNAQPYYITVVKGESVGKVALATQRLGVNKFTDKASCFVVVSEGKSNTLAKFGERLKGLDFKQIDIGIWTAHFILSAKELGLDTCILGWFTEDKIKEICNLDEDKKVRLVIAVGKADEGDVIRPKKRKDIDKIVNFID